MRRRKISERGLSTVTDHNSHEEMMTIFVALVMKVKYF